MDFEEYFLTCLLIIAFVGLIGGFVGMAICAWHEQFGQFVACGLLMFASWVVGCAVADEI
jgi:hypothetical protein